MLMRRDFVGKNVLKVEVFLIFCINSFPRFSRIYLIKGVTNLKFNEIGFDLLFERGEEIVQKVSSRRITFLRLSDIL